LTDKDCGEIASIKEAFPTQPIYFVTVGAIAEIPFENRQSVGAIDFSHFNTSTQLDYNKQTIRKIEAVHCAVKSPAALSTLN
jgi:hypothetical protein